MTTIETLKRARASPTSVPVSPCSSLILNINSNSTADSDESDDVIVIKKSRQECFSVVDDNVNIESTSRSCSSGADSELPKKVRFASAEPELVPELRPEEDGASGDYQGWYTQQDYVTFFRDRQQTIQIYKKAKQVGRMSDFISHHDRFCLRGLESYYQPMNSSAMKRQHRAVHRHHVFMQQYHSRNQQQQQQEQQSHQPVEYVHGNNYNFAEQVVSRMSFYSSRRARILAKWDEQDAMLIHYCSTTTPQNTSSPFPLTDNLESDTLDPTQQQPVVSFDKEDDMLVQYISLPTSIFEEMPYLSVPVFPSYIKKFPPQPHRHHNSHHRSTSFVSSNNPRNNNSNNENNMCEREDFLNSANSPLFGDCI